MDAELKIVRPSFSVETSDATYDVSITDTTYDVSYVSATYELTSTNFTFVSSTVAPTFLVQYTDIVPAVIELGIFILRHNAFDTIFSADIATVNLSKSLTNAARTSDVTRVATTKALYNTVTTSEFVRRGVNKSLQDVGLATQLVSIHPNKVAADVARTADTFNRQVAFTRAHADFGSTSDLTRLGFGATKVDAAATVDSLAFTTAYRRGYTDFGVFNASNEVFLLTPTKVLSELVDQSETLAFDVSTNLYDFVTATDDFDGEAVLDDDQTMTFVKATSDFGAVLDVAALQNNFLREFADAGVIGEQLTFFSGVSFSDTVQQGEILTFSTGLAKSDAVFSADSAAVLFATNVSDNGYATDSNVKSTGVTLSESASFSDSGSLYGQDYVDNLFYFAEDYVGFSRTF